MTMRFNPPPNWPRPPAGWTPPAGWKPDPAWGDPPYGWQLWIDDTPQPYPTGPVAPPTSRVNTAAIPDDPVLYEFTSHVAGKNARVKVFRNRVEWKRTDHLGTGGKVALGVMTGGVSMLATGVRGRKDEEMILTRSITSVTSKRDKLQTLVTVIASGNVIAFRCSGAEADQFRTLLLQLADPQ